MAIETITLQLKNSERDLTRSLPFVRRKISGLRWYILPFFAVFCVALGILLAMYKVGTLSTYQYYVTGPDKIAKLVTVKESLFHAVFAPVMLIALGLFYAVLVIRRVPMMVRKVTAINPFFFDPFTWTVSEEGIEVKTNETEVKYQWSFVKTCYEKLGGLIIVFQSNGYHFIPAREISEENYVKVRKILSEKVGISEG
jgi:hypothetical protein